MLKITIVGAGLTGLTLALLLAKQGVDVLILDEKKEPTKGSKAICFSRRTLEIFDKLGIVKPIFEQGVQWNTGRIFFRNQEVHSFELLPDKHAKYPAFVNISQYEVEQILIAAATQEKNIDLRWQHQIKALETNMDSNEIRVVTPQSEQMLTSEYLVACDGSKSSIRRLLNLPMSGTRSEEKFLIIDFVMEADFPSERWFWFAPPHDAKETILLHKQPNNIWRLDVKLGKEVADDIVNDHDFVLKKIKQVVGDKPVYIEWVSLYRFSNKMLDSFVHGKVIFAGDAAHVFSPFGARGANSGIQDADNLAWKLSKILHKQAFAELLRTYNHERLMAGKQNVICTINSTLFISPPSVKAIAIRDKILLGAMYDNVYKRRINCGRLSVPNVYTKYAISEEDSWINADTAPGNCIKDCTIHEGHLIQKLSHEFTLMICAGAISADVEAELKANAIQVLLIANIEDTLITLYELSPNSAYLIRPDQYILGRWKNFSHDKAITLKATYLSADLTDTILPEPSEQELIDDEVAKMLGGNG